MKKIRIELDISVADCLPCPSCGDKLNYGSFLEASYQDNDGDYSLAKRPINKWRRHRLVCHRCQVDAETQSAEYPDEWLVIVDLMQKLRLACSALTKNAV